MFFPLSCRKCLCVRKEVRYVDKLKAHAQLQVHVLTVWLNSVTKH